MRFHAPAALLFVTGALAAPAGFSWANPPDLDPRDLITDYAVSPAGENLTVYINGRNFVPTEGHPEGTPLLKRLQRIDSGRMEGFCGDSTFVQKSSDKSPPSDHCRALVDYVNRIKGYWLIDYLDPWNVLLARSGDCIFGVHTKNVIGTNVGSQDVVDLLRDSIARFAGVRLGAEGHMGCKLVGTAGVDWAIY